MPEYVAYIQLFKNYILLIMLLHLSQFLPLCAPPPSIPHSLRQSPHHCSCPWVMCISSLATAFPLLYFTSPWLFCTYLFVFLNPLTTSPIPLLIFSFNNWINLAFIRNFGNVPIYLNLSSTITHFEIFSDSNATLVSSFWSL